MNRLIRAFSASALFILAATASSWADPVLPVAAAPEDVGLSSSQLARIEATTRKYVDSGLVPGAVMLFVPSDKRNRAAQPWQMPEAPPSSTRI